VGCVVSIDESNIVGNQADFGGYLYGVNVSTKVRNSRFRDNYSTRSGGCFYFDSTIADFEYATLSSNMAKMEGGAIYATSRTLLKLNESELSSNSAYIGGGITLSSNSRIVCCGCTFQNNTADQSGGVHIESEMTQVIVAQFERTTFRNNNAWQYGGINNYIQHKLNSICYRWNGYQNLW